MSDLQKQLDKLNKAIKENDNLTLKKVHPIVAFIQVIIGLVIIGTLVAIPLITIGGLWKLILG